LIDKYAEFPVTSRALGLQARTLEVFDDMGIVDAIIARGASVYGVTFLQGERVVATVKLRLDRGARPDQPYRGVVILNQAEIEGVMRDRLGVLGGAVERSRELVAFREEADGVIATVSDVENGGTEQIRAAYLVGCDGAHSFVRKALGFTFAGETYPEHFVLGDMEVDGDLPLDTAVAWLNEEGMLASFPFPEFGLRRLIAVVYPDAAGEVPKASLELFGRLIAERAGEDVGLRLSNPVWLSNFGVNRRMVDHYRKGRAFVAGYAAHIHSPSGGQGMNTGIQDAYNLAWKLALVVRGRATPALLDTYEEERLPVARAVLSQTDTNQRLFISNQPVLRFVRERVLLPLMETPTVTDAIVYRGSELGINYRRSSLAQDHEAPLRQPSPQREGERVRVGDRLAFLRAPRAGDRAPDARLRDATTGEPTTLFDQFRGPHFTLLLFDGGPRAQAGRAHLASVARRVEEMFGEDTETRIVASSDARPVPPGWGEPVVLLDPDLEAHKLYGAKAEALYLIRPDGYIGFREEPAAPEPLLGYLGRLYALDGDHHYRRETWERTQAALGTVKRELRVAFSEERSPASLRVAKWIAILAVARRLSGTRWFWPWVLGLPLAGLATHLVYRHKTRGWTRPWGGWQDVEAGRSKT
jgi:2-polyprenyl-6-methoxyphenol hydroxylase-like FAD-dependent oxidoreductase